MKKKLLLAASISAFAVVKSQLTYLGDAAFVHIQDQALVYSGGGVKLDGTSKVNAIGDFMVVSSTDKFETSNTSDFRLKYVSPTVYGQLFIKDMPQTHITGKINKEYVDVAHGTSGRQQVALPFYHFTPTDLQQVLPHINITNANLSPTGRWNKRSVFVWNNNTAAFDQITSEQTPFVGKPTDYFILSRRNYDGSIAWDPTNTAENELTATDNLSGTALSAPITTLNTKKKIFRGVPVSDIGGDTQVILSGAFSGNFGSNGTLKNSYSELYNSYLDDPFVTNKWTGDYGKNVYQHGNPFLTNIDLSFLKKGDQLSDDENAMSNLNGIFYYSSGIERKEVNTIYTNSRGIKATFDSAGNVVGALTDDLIIKPMQEFMVKLADDNPQTLKFNKTRRFAQIARTSGTNYSVTAARGASPSPVVTKQLGVVLLDANNQELGRTYYVVNPEAVTGYASSSARLQAVSDQTAIFTQEELRSGGADPNTYYGLTINEANEIDYKGKKIPLLVNHAQASKLKFFLIEAGRLISENSTLSNGKYFYLEQNGALTKLTSGMTLPLSSGSSVFGLYYEQPEGSLSTAELINKGTFIAKKGEDYVVKFNSDWKSADIEIYVATGQLVYKNNKVSTKSDFVLPLNSPINTVYFVKVKSEQGEIVTKKVIK